VSNRKSSTQTGRALALVVEMRTVFRKLKLRLREHGGHNDLSPSQISVLLRLEQDGSATVSSLARVEGMRPQSMSAIVTPLQEAGLVRGAPDPSDGRQTLMSLTSKCLKSIQEGRAARQDWLTATISQKLSAQEQEKLLPQLDHQPSDIVVTKRSWGAFATTDIEGQLKARGVTQVVVTGVVTSGGVEATARQAYEQAFNVTLALDAMTDMREEAHEYSIRNFFPRVGETGSTQEIISLLEERTSAS
jgi:nicotinamidase-related amidase